MDLYIKLHYFLFEQLWSIVFTHISNTLEKVSAGLYLAKHLVQ